MEKKSSIKHSKKQCFNNQQSNNCFTLRFIIFMISWFSIFSSFIIMMIADGGMSSYCDAGESISGESTSAGKLVFSEGSVLFSLDKGKSWSPVKPSMDFPEGAYIKVESDGEAALMLNDRSQIRLSAGSVLYLKKTGSAPDDEVNKPGILEMFSGKLWFRNKRKGSKPVFETPVISASIRGTEMALSVSDDGSADITVLEGQVKCTNSQGEAVIARGEGVTAQKGTAPIITKLLKPEKSVQWLLLTPDIRGPADEDSKIASNIDKTGVQTAEKAVEFLVQGENRALETAQNAVKLAPQRASTHVALATILQSKGKFEGALKEAEKARLLDPLSVPALIRTVELLLGLDRVDYAEQTIAAFKTEPNKTNNDKISNNIRSDVSIETKIDIRINMLKGYIALIKLDSKKAETLFRQAIEQKKDLASAYLGLGLALYHQKKTSEGLANMEKACLLEPLAAYPHTYLAKAQYELGERYEAEVELKRAATLDPYDPTPHMYLATILADTYRPGEGIKSLEKSISLNDNQLMSRSRYLLDQDKASKNISLAWSLTTMGLYEWADAKGDQAVWDDESNSSAYLFRASRAQILGQVDADTIGDMKRADLLKPVNANTYTSYNDYQNLLETPEVKGSITLNGGTDNTGYGALGLNGGNTNTAFSGSAIYSTTDGPFDGTGKSSSQGKVSVKQVITSGHEVIAEAGIFKRAMEDSAPWQDSSLVPKNIDADADLSNGLLGYHWHQGAGKNLMFFLQSETKNNDKTDLFEKYISPVVGTQFNRKNTIEESDTMRGEIVQLFRFGNQDIKEHSISLGLSQSQNNSSWDLESAMYYDPPFPAISKTATSNGEQPDKKETHLFSRDIWSLSDTFKFDLGVGWCDLDNIVLNDKSKLENTNEWLPHLGFIWQVSLVDTIRGGYFRESEPHVLSGTLQPVEMAGFSKIFGSLQGTLTDFYGTGWDRQWSSQLFTRAELYHKNRELPNIFSSHAGGIENNKELSELSWRADTQDIARLTFEYLISDRLAMAFTYQFTDHNTESGADRNRVDNDLGTTFTWIHPSGVRIQNTWWYMNQNEKGLLNPNDNTSGYINPVDEDFVIASISVEKSLFDKKLLLVAKWENIFDEEYTYLISNITEISQLPWQGSYGLVGLQWNF